MLHEHRSLLSSCVSIGHREDSEGEDRIHTGRSAISVTVGSCNKEVTIQLPRQDVTDNPTMSYALEQLSLSHHHHQHLSTTIQRSHHSYRSSIPINKHLLNLHHNQ